MDGIFRDVGLQVAQNFPVSLAIAILTFLGVCWGAYQIWESEKRSKALAVFLVVGILVAGAFVGNSYDDAKTYCRSVMTQTGLLVTFSDPKCNNVFPRGSGL